MSLQGQRVQDYTFTGVREVFIELFCAPRSSLDNPNLRGFSGGRSFCVTDQGEMDGNTGYWVEDDSNGEVGFLMEFEGTFGEFDDASYVWMARKFAGRRFRKGNPKGKGKERELRRHDGRLGTTTSVRGAISPSSTTSLKLCHLHPD